MQALCESEEKLLEKGVYFETINSLIKKVLPFDLFFPPAFSEELLKKQEDFLNSSLPIIKLSDLSTSFNFFSATLLCKARPLSSNFFYDLMTGSLLFEKKVNVELFFTSDFKFKGLNETFCISEIIIKIGSEEELNEIKKNIKSIESELKLGVVSDFHAGRIMQFKGLAYNKKTAMIQEKIAALIQSRSKDFGQNVFSYMQQFLLSCTEEFKIQRDYNHISRVISVLYLMKKILAQKISETAHRRHVVLKFLKTRLMLNEGSKDVLGVLVGINLLKEHEVFEKKHLLNAVRTYVPAAIEVKDSYFIEKNKENTIETIYLELEKKDGFTFEEIKKLKEFLPDELKNHVEHLTNRIFMPRNEEEIVRNIIILSKQLQFLHDVPQVIINFDEQVGDDLSFIIILLRILKPKDVALQEMFKNENNFKFIFERVKKVGIIRRKYLKEANVFRLLVSCKDYIRKDQSVDLNRARADVMSALCRIFTDVRDYNGGMIYKQNEAFNNLKKALGKDSNEFLLEKFFYAIRPVEMGVVAAINDLKSFFLMLVNAVKREETRIKKHSDYLFKKEPKGVYVIVPVYEVIRKKIIKETISKHYLISSDFISFEILVNDITFLGYVFYCSDELRQKNFLKVIQQGLTFEVESA